MTLRDYQIAAVQALYQYLREKDGNPAIVIPTGGGKTPVMAQICKDAVTQWGGRVLILAHVKELLKQSYGKLRQMCPEIKVGIFSAGLKRRDTHQPVIVGGIQSVWRRAADIGHVDLILVDEAHLIGTEEDGMYRQFLADMQTINPSLRIVGLTATPYRLKTGRICAPENILNEVCYEVGIPTLIEQGFLCPLISKRGDAETDTREVHVRGGEFIGFELEQAALKLVQQACEESISKAGDRKSILVFTSGVKHGEAVTACLRSLGQDAELLTGETSPTDRDRLTAEFQQGTLRWLVNVNVLTTGFDATNIDCVVLLRPTLSPGLYYQMVGRGFRLHPGKVNCLILDFGGNIRRHGPVDAITIEAVARGSAPAPMKTCPQCKAEVPAGVRFCPHCPHVFPEPEKQKHDERPEQQMQILSAQFTDAEYDVEEIYYSVHQKKGSADDDPRTMRVEYKVGFNQWVSDFVCFEHEGYAHQKAQKWWRERSPDPLPLCSDDAVEACRRGRIRQTLRIRTRLKAGEKWERIVSYTLGDMPEPDDGVAILDAGEFVPSSDSDWEEEPPF